MNYFNYDQFSVELLKSELDKVNDSMAEMMERRLIIINAISRKAIEQVEES